MNDYKSAWNDYWQSGLSTSCVSDGEDGYPPAIIDFWENNAFTLLKDNDIVMDLCSGGGGVPKLMIDYFGTSEIKLDIAITDLAKINKNIVSSKRIKVAYYPECNCEDTLFDDESFDFISSSYGIEYSDITKTYNEIYRILKQGGTFAAIIHCYDSEIVKNSNEQLEQGNEILFEMNFFSLFKNIYLAKSKSAVIQRSKEKKLLKCLDEIKLRLLHNNQLHVFRSILNAAHDIFLYGQHNKPIRCIEYINQMEKSLMFNFQRMQNLDGVFLSKKAIFDLTKSIELQGFTININEKILSKSGKVFGLGMVCKK